MRFLVSLFQSLCSFGYFCFDRTFRRLTLPAKRSILAGALSDLPRTKPELIAENVLLRHQLAILQRQVKKPQLTRQDRFLALGSGQSPYALEGSTPDHPTRHPAALASGRVSLALETEIPAQAGATEDSAGNHRTDPTNGAGESLVGR